MNAMHDICSVPDLAAFQHSLNPSGQLYDTYDSHWYHNTIGSRTGKHRVSMKPERIQ